MISDSQYYHSPMYGYPLMRSLSTSGPAIVRPCSRVKMRQLLWNSTRWTVRLLVRLSAVELIILSPVSPP